MYPRRRHAGFTLIEILVVIAIIGILAAILFPVFGRVRAMGRRTSCASNMRQIGMGILQYAQDYDQKIPVGTKDVGYVGNGTQRGVGWAGQTQPYVKSVQVFVCPDDQTPKACSYAINRNMARGTSATASSQTRPGQSNEPLANGRIVSWKAPSRTVLLAEVAGVVTDVSKPYDPATNTGDLYSASGEGRWGTGLSPDLPVNDPTSKVAVLWDTGAMGNNNVGLYPTQCDPIPEAYWPATGASYVPTISGSGRHLSGSNFLFADGHVKALRGTEVSNGWSALNENAAQVNGIGRAEGTANGSHAATFSLR